MKKRHLWKAKRYLWKAKRYQNMKKRYLWNAKRYQNMKKRCSGLKSVLMLFKKKRGVLFAHLFNIREFLWLDQTEVSLTASVSSSVLSLFFGALPTRW